MRRPGNLLTGAVGLTIGLSSIAACSGGETVKPAHSSATITPSETKTPTALETARHSPYFIANPCYLASGVSGEDLVPEFAARCVETRKAGKIALVTYDIPSTTAERLAKDSARILATVTHGLIQPHIEVMPASEAAKEQFKKNTPYGCVNVEDEAKTAAATAEEAMGLEAYSKVVALTTLTSCKADGTPYGAKGAAYALSKNKLIDIFAADPKPPVPPASEFPGSINDKQYDAIVFTHETLHSEGLGHANALIYTDYEATIGYLSQKNTESARPNKKIAFGLDSYIRGGQHQEYGDIGDVQGKENFTPFQTPVSDYYAARSLNVIQHGMLTRPERYLSPSLVNPDHPIEASGTTLTRKNKDSYMSVELEKPLTPDDMTPGAFSYITDFGAGSIYSIVNIVPVYENRGDQTEPTGFKLYLSSANTNSTLHIGDVPASTTTWEFSIGGRKLTVLCSGRTTTAQLLQ